ncbi:MAG TPA: 5-deoxy-glucuronate isomerase [Propionibacteriaceae bacterium]|nr:5-deoxy-glucuronate isomerase [Propionibacteriaceae bacterium]
MDGLYLPAGGAGTSDYDLEITQKSAGWGYSSLRIVSLLPAGTHRFHTESDEVIVVPLEGSATVEVDGSFVDLDGRLNVFAGPTDFAYLPIDSLVTISAAGGGRFALAGARTDQKLPLRYGPVQNVPVEQRGAGQCSRQVRNFATPEAFEAGKIIACEVITPGGNWSSYPAHKHDEQTDTEAELEEIYYFEIASGPNGEPGFGFHRTSSSPGKDIDILAEVHDRDAVLVPYGWHGPCVAAPGFDMYYLNVMAGPGDERAWLISDHPDQGWVRGTWASQAIDPRLTTDAEQREGS